MIYPPKLASDFDKDEITPAATAATTKVYVVPATRRSFYRWRYRHKVNCKIHQYYSFSRRGCGQRLYPF